MKKKLLIILFFITLSFPIPVESSTSTNESLDSIKKIFENLTSWNFSKNNNGAIMGSFIFSLQTELENFSDTEAKWEFRYYGSAYDYSNRMLGVYWPDRVRRESPYGFIYQSTYHYNLFLLINKQGQAHAIYYKSFAGTLLPMNYFPIKYFDNNYVTGWDGSPKIFENDYIRQINQLKIEYKTASNERKENIITEIKSLIVSLEQMLKKENEWGRTVGYTEPSGLIIPSLPSHLPTTDTNIIDTDECTIYGGILGSVFNNCQVAVTKESINKLIETLLSFALSIAAVLVTIYIVISGYKIMIAGASGNPKEIGTAKSGLTAAIIGLIIILLAQFIVLEFIRLLI